MPKRSAGDGGDKLRVSWSKHEDDTIRHCVDAYGPKWSLIAAELPGRTEHAVRNRWHRLQNLDNDPMHPHAGAPHAEAVFDHTAPAAAIGLMPLDGLYDPQASEALGASLGVVP